MRYQTVRGEASAEYEISRSRFIAYVRRAASGEEAASFLQAVKKKHWDARHHCSAYVIGERGQLQKADDDGEPSGTAGKPILETIKKNHLSDTVIAVTRYFGGIKLGAGGLIRAYGKAAALGLDAAEIVEKELFARLRITLEYAFLGAVENNLRAQGYRVEEKTFTDCVALTVLVKAGAAEAFASAVNDWTSANCLLEDLGETYVEIPLRGPNLSISL